MFHGINDKGVRILVASQGSSSFGDGADAASRRDGAGRVVSRSWRSKPVSRRFLATGGSRLTAPIEGRVFQGSP